jgi:hypothetical protein
MKASAGTHEGLSQELAGIKDSALNRGSALKRVVRIKALNNARQMNQTPFRVFTCASHCNIGCGRLRLLQRHSP